MKGEWPKTKLGNKITIQTGYPFESKRYTENSEDIPLLRGANISQGRLDWGNEKRWPVSSLDDVKSHLLQHGDVVLAMDRPWIEAGLKFARITDHHCPCLLVQRVAKLSSNEDFDQRFLQYVIQERKFIQYIKSVQTGSTVPHISAEQIRNYQFRCPPLRTQRRIANVLGALDDKIALNRQMNQTLEAMAQALYHHWFVDFGPFQDEPFQDSELGPIPKGWEVGKVDDICDVELSNTKPQENEDEHFWYYSFSAHDDGKSPIPERGGNIKSSKSLIVSRRVMVARLNPRKYRVWTVYPIDGKREISSTEFIHFVPAEDRLWSFLNCYLRGRRFINEFRSHTKGTTGSHQRVSRKIPLSFDLCVPSQQVLDAFQRKVDPIWKLIHENRRESQVLAETRDYLLPKLISGEIEVSPEPAESTL